MWGRATLAMEVSSTSIKAARATVAAISQGFVFGFHAYIAAFAADASAVVAIVLRFPQDLAAWPYVLLIDAEHDRGDAISKKDQRWRLKNASVLAMASLAASAL